MKEDLPIREGNKRLRIEKNRGVDKRKRVERKSMEKVEIEK